MNYNDQAIEIAALEIARSGGADDPIIGVVPARGAMMRGAWATLVKAMTAHEEYAARQIVLGSQLYSGHLGIKIGGAYGDTGGRSTADMADWRVECMRRYSRWLDGLYKHNRDMAVVARLVLCDDYNFNQAALIAARNGCNISPRSVKGLTISAVREYVAQNYS